MENARSALPFLRSKNEKYDVLYVNTPWSTLDKSKISKFPANEVSKENSALFIWVDTYKMKDAMDLIDNWGFTFHSVYQIADMGQYPWMKKDPVKKNKVEEPIVVVEEGVVHEVVSEVVSDVVSEVVSEIVAPGVEDTKTKSVRKTKMPLVTNPKWWSSSPKNTMGTRATTEQLWLAVRGDASGLLGSTMVPTQVVNIPEHGKKSRSKKRTCLSEEWDTERPKMFLDLVIGNIIHGKTVLDVFSSSIHDKVDSWGPSVPGGFSRSFSSNEGLVSVVNTCMKSMKKSQLQMLANKFLKYDTSTVEEKNEMLESSSVAWLPMKNNLEGSVLELPYNWKGDSNIPTNWIMYMIQVIASKHISEFDITRKKKRKRKTSSVAGSNRPRHGIACASKISPELADFFGMDHTEKLARTVAVSKLNEYIVKNGLQNPERKIEIMLDEPLKTLLNPPEGFGVVTYFNLCNLVGKHFPKKTESEKKLELDARTKKENSSMSKEDVNISNLKKG